MSIKERATETQFSNQASSELQQNVTASINNAFRIDSTDNQDNLRNAQPDITIKEPSPQKGSNDATAETDLTEYIETVLNLEKTGRNNKFSTYILSADKFCNAC